jgi:hypothetical protein
MLGMNKKPIFVALAVALVAAAPLFADVAVSLVSVRNLSGDPRSDYVGALAEGVLLYDLSRAEGVELVDRASLDKVLEEQELQVSGLVDDRNAAVKVGKLVGATWLIMIDYVPLGTEVAFTAKAIAVATGKVSAFNERGSGENAVHKLAEALVELFTGRRVSFADPEGDRSILSLRDETPGSIAVHSFMSRGEIFVDGEFVGFTTGDLEKPYIVEGLRPGKHTVRIHVGRDFGVVKLPEVAFVDWEVVVDVKPGKRSVVRDETRHFNDHLVKLIYLYDRDFKVSGDDLSALAVPIELTVVDRKGKELKVTVLLNPKMTKDGLSLTPELIVNGVKTTLPIIVAKKDKEIEFTLDNGIIKLELELDWRYATLEVGVELRRTDIWQNMW